MINRHIIPNDRGFPNHHPRAVINKQIVPDFGPRVNLDTRYHTGDVGKNAGQQATFPAPQPVIHAVKHDGMKAVIGQQDLPKSRGDGVTLLDGFDKAGHTREILNFAKHRQESPQDYHTVAWGFKSMA
jgi:hypothetical protein